MYIIHCLVRNNTRIIPPWRTFVNGVFSAKYAVSTTLYISHRIFHFPPIKLVILPKGRYPVSVSPFHSLHFQLYHRLSAGFISFLLYFYIYFWVFFVFFSDMVQNLPVRSTIYARIHLNIHFICFSFPPSIFSLLRMLCCAKCHSRRNPYCIFVYLYAYST